MKGIGYAWEPYTVQTDDGWTNTIFRVTGKYDEYGNL